MSKITYKTTYNNITKTYTLHIHYWVDVNNYGTASYTSDTKEGLREFLKEKYPEAVEEESRLNIKL